MRGTWLPDPPTFSRVETFLVLAVLAVNVLDDFFYIHAKVGITEFVLIDYAKKTAMFFVCILPLSLRAISRQAFAAPSVPWRDGGWLNPHVWIVTALVFLCDEGLYYLGVLFDWNLALPRLATFPAYHDDLIKYLDLGLGLLWNSVAEELFYRAVLIAFLFRFVRPVGIRILIAGFLFGTAHWFQGPVWIVQIAIDGCLYGYLYSLTRSIVPGIVIHTLHNLIVFTS